MCKIWLGNGLPAACLQRQSLRSTLAPTQLLLVEEWVDEGAMNSYLSSEPFRAVIGAVGKCSGNCRYPDIETNVSRKIA